MNTWAALQEEYTKGIESLRNEFTAHGYFERLRFQAFSDTIMVSLPVKKREVGSDINKDMIKKYTTGIHFTRYQNIILSVRITILARFALDMMPHYGLKQVINK